MANVKSTKPRGRPKKAAEAPQKPTEATNQPDLTQTLGQITDALTALGARLDKLEQKQPEPPKGQKVVQLDYDPADLVETMPPTEEEIATWTPEQVKEFNEREVRKMRARKKAQEEKRRQFQDMSVTQRRQALREQRDPNEIRVAIDPGYDGDDYVRVQCLRRVGLGGDVVSDIDEIVDMPRHQAKRLQESGVIRIAL